MADPDQQTEVFEALKKILKKHERQLDVQTDEAGHYSLNTKKLDAKKRPHFFGAVQIRKKYVSFHLMPVYCLPELLEDVSDDLRKRMQGKSCFNFTVAEKPLLKELEGLTQESFRQYKTQGFV